MNVGTQTPRQFFKISRYPLLKTYTLQLNKMEKQLLKRISKEKNNLSDPQSNSNKIQIGSNGTQLNKKMYLNVDWTCYRKATRDLCYMIFGRETLGTHTLTGRVGPWDVMHNRKTKPQLPSQQVEDILQHILTKFNVAQSAILHAIRVACSNSARMLRSRMKREQLAN